MNRREFIRTTSLAASALVLGTSARAAEAGFPVVRIPEAKRKFKSPAVERTIQRVRSSIGNKELGWMFENCFPNTLDTTVEFEVLDGRPDQVPYEAIDITVRRNAFGRQVDSFEADVDIPAVGGEPLRAVFIRAPWVESVGPAVDVLARVSRGDDDTIVAVRQGPLLATAFHPELTGDARVHELFVEMVRKQA